MGFNSWSAGTSLPTSAKGSIVHVFTEADQALDVWGLVLVHVLEWVWQEGCSSTKVWQEIMPSRKWSCSLTACKGRGSHTPNNHKKHLQLLLRSAAPSAAAFSTARTVNAICINSAANCG